MVGAAAGAVNQPSISLEAGSKPIDHHRETWRDMHPQACPYLG